MSQEAASLQSHQELTARERVDVCLARIEADNGVLHAVSELFADEARARADRLDQAARTGSPKGPMHGIPVLFKELVDIEGRETRFGSKVYAQAPAAHNAPVIDRLEAAGAIILGVTHMVEFAVGSWGTNAARGTPQNPANCLDHFTPGGSSSGSGAAVAAGFAPIAFGSDTGGSIRIPATLCGVIGYKPSYGLIPMQGVAPTGPSFDTLGPLTRTIKEARLAVEAAAGLPLSHPKVPLAGTVIAHVSKEALDPIEPANFNAYQSTLSALAEAGAKLVPITLPLSFVELQQVNGDIVAFEAYRHLAPLIDDMAKDLDPNVRQRIKHGASISATAYRNRLEELQALRQDFDQRMGAADFFFLPGTPLPAQPLQAVDEALIPMSRYTRLANCVNLCAIALPVATEARALPLGIQIAARSGNDAKLLAFAETVYEQVLSP